MKALRLALLGFGTVGQWLAEALHTRRAWLQHEYGAYLLTRGVSIVALPHCGKTSPLSDPSRRAR